MSGHEQVGGAQTNLVARSFLVRALLEDATGAGPRWHGIVTDVQTGTRTGWHHSGEIARAVDLALTSDVGPGADGLDVPAVGADVSAPTLTDVVTAMLGVLGARLPAPLPGVPDSNVTIEQVTAKPVGLGDHIGTEGAPALGTRTLRGGRLDARVRFQLWAGSSPEVDAAVLDLQSTLLDDRDALRAEGFLRFAASQTTIAEHIPVVPAWRKASSYDVLYEYRYTADDDADSLIARIPVTTGHGDEAAPTNEAQTIVDELRRWDDEGAPALTVTGPTAVGTIAAIAYVPGPALGGTVTFARSSGAGPTAFADLDGFLTAAGGAVPTHRDATVTLTPAAALAALGPAVPGPDLGDWDTDGTVDAYSGAARRLTTPILLAAGERFEITYTPPGASPGLDQTAVVYLRLSR
ncbi:hypothetical protein [Occultella gossypii]|uniref:Uncharacterized protein n=1 Tax=Occultella gossypii TaxID=2800820 RepID=A0ABS7SH27_9MICO|nr:hypothetical protein [Occultella gossypii]MBZ2199666.1 hypothetical protein [Occultella gossypii]